MTELSGTLDYVLLFALAAGCGALGGLANELLQDARGTSGNLRLWNYSGAGRLLNLGFVGPVFLGAVAAVVILIFLPFESQTVVGADRSVTNRVYDPLRLVPLSLAAGVAGSAVLTAAQTRLLAMISDQRIALVETTGKQAVERTAAAARDDAARIVQSMLEDDLAPAIQALLARAKTEVPPGLSQQLASRGVSDDVVRDAVSAIPKSGPLFAPQPDVDRMLESLAVQVKAAVEASAETRAAEEKQWISAVARAAGEVD